MQNSYVPRDQNQTVPFTKVSVETAPRDSHVLITQRKKWKKCRDFKSSVRTPKHLSIPHTGGEETPNTSDWETGQRGVLTHQPLECKASCFSSSGEVTQQVISIELGNFYKQVARLHSWCTKRPHVNRSWADV